VVNEVFADGREEEAVGGEFLGGLGLPLLGWIEQRD
jgi:hypothetical protein